MKQAMKTVPSGRPYSRVSIFALTLLIAVFVVSVFPSTAQAQRDPERMKQQMAEQVDGAMKALALEGDKADVVKKILTDGSTKQIAMMSEMSGGQGGREGMREKVAAIDKEVEEKLAAVLSVEQLETYKTFKKSQTTRRRGDGPPRNGGTGGQ